jgi:hypothetical protein
VEAALEALPDYCRRCDVNGKSDEEIREEEAWIGLAKYFCLADPSAPEYWERVAGIRGIFYKISLGMMAVPNSADAYVVELSDFGDAKAKVQGGVPFSETKSAGVSPIRAAFGFQDEWGHSPCLWRRMEGPIRINTRFLPLPPAGKEKSKAHEVARIIVHEGSHKWAQTKDIMYKASTIGTDINTWYEARDKEAKSFKFEQLKKKMTAQIQEPRPQSSLPSDSQVLQEMMGSYMRERWAQRQEQEAAIAVPMGKRDKVRGTLGNEKKLVKMAGERAMAFDLAPVGTEPIADERWLENADSYAWFARRMWKRATKNRS